MTGLRKAKMALGDGELRRAGEGGRGGIYFSSGWAKPLKEAENPVWENQDTFPPSSSFNKGLGQGGCLYQTNLLSGFRNGARQEEDPVAKGGETDSSLGYRLGGGGEPKKRDAQHSKPI